MKGLELRGWLCCSQAALRIQQPEAWSDQRQTFDLLIHALLCAATYVNRSYPGEYIPTVFDNHSEQVAVDGRVANLVREAVACAVDRLTAVVFSTSKTPILA
jgi:hypothetical protein